MGYVVGLVRDSYVSCLVYDSLLIYLNRCVQEHFCDGLRGGKTTKKTLYNIKRDAYSVALM